MIVSLPSRNQLLAWISQLTNTNVEKIEQLSDGLAFCEIFDKLYPKIINMTKLKRQPKIPIQKEKNFRLLLNAINQMELCVAINIVELSQGKVTSILELLQWFYKQYKNPTGKGVPGQEKEQKYPEPRMIKTYVGNLIDRQKTYQKQNKGPRSDVSSSRRSLDAKLIQKSVFETEKSSRSVRSKSVYQSEHKPMTEKKEKPSMVKSIVLDQEKFEQHCSQKKQSMKKQLSEKVDKMSQKKSSVKSQVKTQQISEHEERKVLKILSKALNSEKPQLQDTLIKVTQAAIEGNPQLEAKLRIMLQGDTEKKQTPLREQTSPDTEVRNILDSYRNTSQICENDTIESIPFETCELIIECEQPQQNHEQAVQRLMNHMPFPVSNKKSVEQDRKETVKKSTMKSGADKKVNPSMIKSNKAHPISLQKERQIQIYPSLQYIPRIDQNIDQNSKSKGPQKCLLFNPHGIFQKIINPETLLTEKKAEVQKDEKLEQHRRQVQSENFSAGLAKDDDIVWKRKQDGSTQN